MRITMRSCLTGLALVLLLAGIALGQGLKPSLIAGTEWQQATQEMKVAYIRGVGNMADYEVALSGKKCSGCLSADLVRELKGKSIEDIVSEVDKYYKENPDKLNIPVMEAVLRQCTSLGKPKSPGAPAKK